MAGFRSIDPRRADVYYFVRRRLMRGLVVNVAMAVLSVIVLVVVFDVEVDAGAATALISTVLFGTTEFFLQTRPLLPHGRLTTSPVRPEPRPLNVLREIPGALLLLAAVAGAWFLSTEDDSLVWLLPGQGLGYAVAATIGIVTVRRWESSGSQRLVAHRRGFKDELYSLPA